MTGRAPRRLGPYAFTLADEVALEPWQRPFVLKAIAIAGWLWIDPKLTLEAPRELQRRVTFVVPQWDEARRIHLAASRPYRVWASLNAGGDRDVASSAQVFFAGIGETHTIDLTWALPPTPLAPPLPARLGGYRFQTRSRAAVGAEWELPRELPGPAFALAHDVDPDAWAHPLVPRAVELAEWLLMTSPGGAGSERLVSRELRIPAAAAWRNGAVLREAWKAAVRVSGNGLDAATNARVEFARTLADKEVTHTIRWQRRGFASPLITSFIQREVRA